MTKIISIMNQKGGVGKSTLVLSIGSCLARKGYKTLLLDLDGQKSLSYMATQKLDFDASTADLLQGDRTALDNPISLGNNLALVPASDSLYSFGTYMDDSGIQPNALKDALSGLKRKSEYDFVLLDTPPALGFLSVSSLLASDFVLCPCLADLISIQAFDSFARSVATAKKANRGLRLLGVVLTRFAQRTVVANEIATAFGTMTEAHGTKLFRTRIRESNSFKVAQREGRTVFDLPKHSGSGAEDIEQLTTELLHEAKQ